MVDGTSWGGGVGVGLELGGAVSWVVVDGLTFQHYGSFEAIGLGYGSGTSNVVIQNVTIHDCGSNYDQDHGIYLNQNNVNTTIRNCTIYNCSCSAIQAWHVPGSINTYMYNNVIYNCRLGIIWADGANGCYFYNNTVNHCSVGIDFDMPGDTDKVGVVNAVVKNNIVTNCLLAGLQVGSYDESQVVSDYNLYYGNATDVQWNGKNYTVAGFQSAKPEVSGNEAHSISANPSYVNSSAANYQLNSGSPAIGAGTPISQVTTNFNNVRRTVYDMGAY